MRIPGYIQWARSKTGREFPILVFSADVDFVTAGMVSLTSCKRREVVVTMATSREWTSYAPKHLEKRVNRELKRSDLKCIELLRAEGSRLVYSDPFEPKGEAKTTRTQTLTEFRKAGGVITRHRFPD